MSKNDSLLTFAQTDFICYHKNSYALTLEKNKIICDDKKIFIFWKKNLE